MKGDRNWFKNAIKSL